uniref:Transcription factor E2F8 n=1 Tax=Anolis carolinensis TaxID=28377 RepID=G1KRJ4_ANOCA|nr:PREDICTED: transcription factor E2F8 isoform X1 [Anolis carolinensis]|eukprot:XP_008104506.1 PREDICTED: transcription factor E2F8 isoform X1 [Anolis carolinensis]
MNTEDKENQSFEAGESTVQTPLKWTATSSSVLEEMQPAVSGRLTTPPKPSEVSSRDPWTPTANLKMLISAASPEIRNREQEKKLSNCRSESFEEHLSGDEYEKSQPSRKDKSLGLLCHKFLARYPCYPNPSQNNEICLDEVSEELNVERRRIYDIMNVLESLHMVSRLAKNKYSWHGCYNLKRTLQILKKVAEENKYTDQIELIKKRESEQEKDGQKTELVTKHIMPNDHTDICFVEFPGMEFRTASVKRKDKSLRVMSQKFVMLFLVSSHHVVSLEVAAKMLIGEDHMEYLDKSKFKTKIRRLYDIANVLSSLELIKKVHISEDKSRKPAFKWTGPDIFSDTQGTQPVPTTAMIISSHPEKGKSSKENCSKNLFPTRSKQGFTRHPSLIKTAKTMQIDQRKIRSAPSSPIKKNTSQIASSLPSKMAQLAAICKQQLDEQSRDLKKMEMKLEHYTLPGSLGPPPGSCLKPKPSQDEILPLIPSSGSPAMLTHVHSNVPYVLYFPPSQTQIVTAHSRGFSVQPFPCTNVMAMNSPVETSSQLIPEKKCIEDSDINLAAGDASSKEQSFGLAKEQEGRRDDLISGKCFKMCESVLEDTPIKKCKNEELEHQDGLQTCLPSGYLIPFPQFTKLLSETTVSSSKKTEQEQKTYGSPIADGIPVTSNATKINFPTLQFTPLNLMVPSSVATVSVANGPAVTLSHAAPVQAPNLSLLNFMLQHVGLMPANVQASVNQVFGSALVCQQAEHVNAVPRSVSMKKRKALQNVLPKESSGFSGKTVPTTPLKTTTVSAVPNDSYKGNGSVFQMSCEPSLIPGFCSSSCEPDKISQEELVVQQRELDMSIEDDDV